MNTTAWLIIVVGQLGFLARQLAAMVHDVVRIRRPRHVHVGGPKGGEQKSIQADVKVKTK